MNRILSLAALAVSAAMLVNCASEPVHVHLAPHCMHLFDANGKACRRTPPSEWLGQPWVAGERFTVADITAFCTLEFARLMRFKADRVGLTALQSWRDRMAARPSAAG